MPSRDTSSEITIDQRGDVRLKVGTDEDAHGQITFLACSRALARSSPVMERMLYGNFLESRPNSKKKTGDDDDGSLEDWVVRLPEVNPQPMRTLLYLSHAQYHEVINSSKETLTIDEMYELTALTHYYDCTRLVVPWVGGLMPSIEDLLTSPAKAGDLSIPKMLWVSWELGLKDAFVDLSNKMMMESRGKWTTEEINDEMQTPPGILEHIENNRLNAFQMLLDIFRDMVEALIVVDERPRWCRHATWMGPHRCESMILGSITFCLARAGLWPLPKPQELDYSILDLYSKLTSLVIHDIGEAVSPGGSGNNNSGSGKGGLMADHAECNPRQYLLDKIRQAMNEIPSPLTKLHTEHLERQAARLVSG